MGDGCLDGKRPCLTQTYTRKVIIKTVKIKLISGRNLKKKKIFQIIYFQSSILVESDR